MVSGVARVGKDIVNQMAESQTLGPLAIWLPVPVRASVGASAEDYWNSLEMWWSKTDTLCFRVENLSGFKEAW